MRAALKGALRGMWRVALLAIFVAVFWGYVLTLIWVGSLFGWQVGVAALVLSLGGIGGGIVGWVRQYDPEWPW